MAFWNFDLSLLNSVRRSLGFIANEAEMAPSPTDQTPGPSTAGPPPPHGDQQEESPSRIWTIDFKFISDRQGVKRLGSVHSLVDWTAYLDIETRDLAGIMRDGLFLTHDNVREEEGRLRSDYWPEDKSWVYTRSYTIVDSRWSGFLHVCAWDVRPVANFRLHHLTADKVEMARVEDDEENTVYCYDVDAPDCSANFIYDDMPMDGLWPWPKEECEVEGQPGQPSQPQEDS
ncbi:hypothetical protein CEP51_015971 [Fusarium floridanum]|uniref:Uncharacterized protein n=1 Tax=Fusarium floridanum TaxID=1325733 RepID=A0A428NZG1_9HYPO|nr:hypothetical protein CEP51_015971 [Fusarium floridanum]